jgi:hypothetical protein
MKVTQEILTSIGFEANGSYWANFRRLDHKPTEVTGITYVGYGPTDRSYRFLFFKNRNYYRLRRKFTQYTSELQTSDNNSSCQIVYNKIKEKEIKPRHQDCRCGVDGWSVHYYLWACRRARSAASDRSRVYGYAASIKEQ